MKLKMFFAAFLAMIFGDPKEGRFVGRARTTDVSYPFSAFLYRMSAGFLGEVNRSHPASIEPAVNNATNPVQFPGYPGVVDSATNSIRRLAPGDTALTTLFGFAVRAFPTQAASTSGAYGQTDFNEASLPVGQPIDFLRSGYILAPLSAGTATKGGAVFVWVAATSGPNVQGSLRTTASAGNTAALDPARYQFNGPADANGVVEIVVNP